MSTEILFDREESQLFYGLPLPPVQSYLFGLWHYAPLVKLGDQIAKQEPPEPVADVYRLTIQASGELGKYVCSKSTPSHQGAQLNAIDFLVPVGTPVRTMLDGAITDIVEHHSEYGAEESFADKANYLTIRHGFGEFSQYVHLVPNSAMKYGITHVGQKVERGQIIGEVGMTGYTDRPHLHLLVFRGISQPPGYKSLVIRFS